MAAAPEYMAVPSGSGHSLGQPPPTYENASGNGEHESQPQQQYVHMTTTQTVTVTTQMILPLLRRQTAKRDPQLDHPVQSDTERRPRCTLMLNKDLPLPPADDLDVHTTQSQSRAPPAPLSATFALAHAALGLGLPSALPQPPRVSVSGPPASLTTQLTNDVESRRGPLARLRAGGTTNGTNTKTPKQRTRFISLGVHGSPTPESVSNEPHLPVHDPTPRISSGAFGKKVRRAKSFTNKRKSTVVSTEADADGYDAYRSEGEQEASRNAKRASWWTKRRADSKTASSLSALAHDRQEPPTPFLVPNPVVLPPPAGVFSSPSPSAVPVPDVSSGLLKKKRLADRASQRSPSRTSLTTDASAPRTHTPIAHGFVNLSHSPVDREATAPSLPRLPSTSIAKFSPLLGAAFSTTASPAGTLPLSTRSSVGFPSDTITPPPASPMPISQSQPTLSHSSSKSPVKTTRSRTLDPGKVPPGERRARSSSLFSKNVPSLPSGLPTLTVPGSPPVAAKAEPQRIPRPRTAPQPPLLRRLSSALFFSSSSQGSPAFGISPTTSSFFGTPPPPHAPAPSPVRTTKPPQPAGDSPSIYVSRLLSAVTKAEVASVLASSADEFHTAALNEYMRRFSFVDDPLDVALRKLLMDVGLPRETQQIDRVMEAFARRYNECNDGIWGQEDHSYVLAFSLMMLHTDAFNKHNKNKMTKAGYVKNTRLPGVLPEMLEYFFDNITFAPFIFIEDPMDINGQRGLDSSSTPTSSVLGRSNKVDPYFLITQGRLNQLRVEMDRNISKGTPYSPNGAPEPWNEEELRKAFASAMVVRGGMEEYDHMRSPRRHASVPTFAGYSSNGPALLSPLGGGIPPSSIRLASSTMTGEQRYKLTKVGILNRKDDLADGGTRVSSRGRKWKACSVVLTGSSLLFFKNLDWYREIEEGGLLEEGGHALHGALQGANETISLNDAIAVIDATYTKYPTTFRLVLGTGKQLLIGASDDEDRNDWMARINYASAFRTAGVRMRHAMPDEDAELLGVMAARSHLQQILPPQLPPAQVYSWGSPAPAKSSTHSIYANSPTDDSFHGSRLTFNYTTGDIGVVSPSSSVEDLREQARDAMEVAKAELASSVGAISPGTRSRAISVGVSSVMEGSINDSAPSPSEPPSLRRSSGRSDVLTAKIKDFESRITTTQLQLDADLRAAWSLAILTPFQQATRNRLQEAIQPLAKRIKLCQLELAKLECHRDILRDDLAAGEQDWESTKDVIAKAARRAYASNPRRNLIPFVTQIVTPPEDHRRRASEAMSSDAGSTDRESSRGGSVRQGLSHSTSIGSLPPMNEGVELGAEKVSNPRLSPSRSLRGKRPRFSEDSSDGITASVQHERFVTALEAPHEEAEEWNKTKAAKRVSLVRVPIDALRVFANSHPETAVNHAALKEEAASPRNSIASDAVRTPRASASGG